MKFLITIGVLILFGVAITPVLQRYLPAAWNPFLPLNVTDAPSFITRYKLKRLSGDPAACIAVLQRAQKAGAIRFTEAGSVDGNCPLSSPVRVVSFGEVRLSTSFLASCPLALSSAMYVTQVVKPLAASEMGSPLARIDHVGSYACRNIYHRAQGRLSEHATADALDVTAFQLNNGRRISVAGAWAATNAASPWLKQIFQQSCRYYGNALGPDYNAAHAGHFHLGMQGFGICR
ncbi:extensin-like domain-containing protein [Erwinia oleae]|uniref:extensin-like domain-containing protein n=1 Tax=Erwinia oleae TaxID=796334 RepID=UPI0005576778